MLLTYGARNRTIAMEFVKIVCELDRKSYSPTAVRHSNVKIAVDLSLCVVNGGGTDDDIACSGAATI